MRYTFVRSYRHRLPFEVSNTLRVSDDTYEFDPGGLRISSSELDRVYVVVTFRVRLFVRGRGLLGVVFVILRNRLRETLNLDDGLDVQVSFWQKSSYRWASRTSLRVILTGTSAMRTLRPPSQ